MLVSLYSAILSLLTSLRLASCRRKIDAEQSSACDVVLERGLFKLQALRDYVAEKFSAKYLPDQWYILKRQRRFAELLKSSTVDSADI